MTTQEKMEHLCDIMDLEIEELNEDMILEDIEEWDSVAVLSFIALMDEEFGKAIKGADIRSLKSVKDLLNVMEE